jgi:hypothetical protein
MRELIVVAVALMFICLDLSTETNPVHVEN